MPRRGAKLSPEAKDRQKRAEAEWRKEHMTNLSITIRKERKEASQELAIRRDTSLRSLVVGFLEGECEKEGIPK